jgi:menaquinol-cytochrome c reductase cytochrome b subunit
VALEHATVAEPSPLDTDEVPILIAEAVARSRASRTWTLGAVAVGLLIFAAVSGLGLLFYYRPLVAAAHPGLVDLMEVSRAGFLRGLHRWAAHLFLITIFLHLLRVVVTGAYRPPRRANYHVGVVLLVISLLFMMTGWILPWDRHAQWLLAAFGPSGYSLAESRLLSIYALHCGVLPVVGSLLVLYHLQRAHRDDASTPTTQAGSSETDSSETPMAEE